LRLLGPHYRFPPAFAELQAAYATNPTPALLPASRALAAQAWALVLDSSLSRSIPAYFQPNGQPFLEIYLANVKHIRHHTYQVFVYLKLLHVSVHSRHLYRFVSPDG
jgi:hypothetical protein